eukprot:TRINITY_DN10829_c0_g1_i1.p1 TRINITY_DN10829_c0_g1~~TRINITY_DN10829_c0_g1_i1.p1  ORF type:complete len:117 (+),score=21.35 TRINITY_DN10829_c0_g1_i1:237-587(+)
MSLSKRFRKAKLRVMGVSTHKYISQKQISLANLLAKFRIEADTKEVTITGGDLTPSDMIMEFYDGLDLSDGPTEEHNDSELDIRTTRMLFLSDRIREYSQDAAMVAICILIPRSEL